MVPLPAAASGEINREVGLAVSGLPGTRVLTSWIPTLSRKLQVELEAVAEAEPELEPEPEPQPEPQPQRQLASRSNSNHIDQIAS